MKKNVLLTVGCIVVLSVVSSNAFATFLSSDDFEGYTVGQALPKNSTASHGPYSYSSSPAGVATVQNDPAGVSNQVLKLYRESSSVYFISYFKNNITLSDMESNGEKLVYTFDIYVSSANDNSLLGYLDAGSGKRLGGYYLAAPNSSDQCRVSYISYDAVRHETRVATSVYLDDDSWYSGTYILYQLGGNWVYSLSFSDGSNEYQVASDVQFYPEADNLKGNNIRLGFSPQGANVTSYIDDLYVETQLVPEPATMLFVLFGLFYSRFCKRK